MQQDTLFGEMERPLTQNLYVYCLNNGVNLRDPSGNYSVPLSIEMAGPKAVEDYLIGTGQKKKSKTDTLNDQKKKAESMGVTGFTLAGIQAEIDKIESNSNKPNGGGSGSGNSGNNGNNLTPSGGVNSGGGGYIDNIPLPSYGMTQEEARLAALEEKEIQRQIGKFEAKLKEIMKNNGDWKGAVVLFFKENQIYNQYDYEKYLAKIGCSITSLAMGEAYMLGIINSPVFFDYNENRNKTIIPFDIKDKKGLISGWGDSVTKYEPYPELNDAYNIMASEIKAGRPVITQVQGSNKNNPNSTHYVLTIGAKAEGSGAGGQYTRDDFIIMDTYAKTSKYNSGEPKLDQIKLLSAYPNQIGTPNQIRIMTFEGMKDLIPKTDRRNITIW